VEELYKATNETSVSIIDVADEIRTLHLPNKSLDNYSYTFPSVCISYHLLVRIKLIFRIQ
jgi:hypothetical protein